MKSPTKFCKDLQLDPDPPPDAIIAYKNNKLYDYSKAKSQFYDVHHQLMRQKGHFTKEQYDELLENAPEVSEEEVSRNVVNHCLILKPFLIQSLQTRMIALGGHVMSDADSDSSAVVPRLDLEIIKKRSSVFDREEEVRHNESPGTNLHLFI